MDKQDLPNRNSEDKLEIACKVIEHRLGVIWNAVDAIDSKTNIILGFASVIITVLVGFFSLDPSKWQTPSLVLFSLALISYILIVILSILSYRIRLWSYKPDPATLLKHCIDTQYDSDDIREWVAKECQAACCDNLKLMQKKSRLTNWVLYMFTLETEC